MSYNVRPEQLIECPFDKNHKITAAKLANHIVKCRRSHPELDAQLETCPFNALHRFLPQFKAKHIMDCPDNNRIFHLKTTQIPERFDLPVPIYRPPVISNQEDDWDDTDPELFNRNLNEPAEIPPLEDKRPRELSSASASGSSFVERRGKKLREDEPTTSLKSERPRSMERKHHHHHHHNHHHDNNNNNRDATVEEKQPSKPFEDALGQSRRIAIGRGALLKSSLTTKKRRPDDEN